MPEPATDTATASNTSTKQSPLRLLILTPTSSSKPAHQPIPPFLQTLTGTATSADLTTFAGYTSHPPLHLKTKYYESNVSIWCDELPAASPSRSASKADPDPSLSEWQMQMLSSEAREVRDVIGGIALLLPFDSAATVSTAAHDSQISGWVPYIEAVTSLRDAVEDESGRDVASIVIVQDMTSATLSQGGAAATDESAGTGLLEQLEEAALSTHGIFGWDYILWSMATATSGSSTSDGQSSRVGDDPEALNTFGEKTGFPRIVEVLEGIDWAAGPAGSDLDLDTDYTDGRDASLDFLDDLDSTRVKSSNSAGDNNAILPGNSTGVASDKDLLDDAERDFTNEMMEVKMNLLTHRDDGDFGEDKEAEEEFQVEQLSGLMERVVAIREAAGAMSGSEKERFAKREIEKIMREMG